ncbi:MAG: hypothetical protein DDT20_01657 [Firmicutes bacterium]|nr:hypothetical protein [Bacillota bacterium]
MSLAQRIQVDLNCDMAESFGPYTLGHDELIMPHITSANIACGFHAGDPSVMRKTVALAKAHGVRVGAHPGYPDLAGFGRRQMGLTPHEIYDGLVYQIGALLGVARSQNAEVTHVKVHGALYNAAAVDERLATAIARAIRDVDSALWLVGMCGSEIIEAGLTAGLRVAREVFADRAYQADGTLVPRNLPGAVHTDVSLVVRQALDMVTKGFVTAVSGERIPVSADTMCTRGRAACSSFCEHYA